MVNSRISVAVRAESIDEAQFREDYARDGATAVKAKYDLATGSLYGLLDYWHIPRNSPVRSAAAKKKGKTRASSRALTTTPKVKRQTSMPPHVVFSGPPPLLVGPDAAMYLSGVIAGLRLVLDSGAVQR